MTHIALLTASPLAVVGCATPTGPSDEEAAAKAAKAKAALEAASTSGPTAKPMAKPTARIAVN